MKQIKEMYKNIRYLQQIVAAKSTDYICYSLLPLSTPYFILEMNIINALKPLIYDSTVGYLYTKNAIQHMLSSIPDNSKILDVGIGTGYTYTKNADLIKRKNISIVGVDIDASYVKYAKHAMIDYELDDNIRVIKGDIYDVKLDVGTFDYVIFSDS